MCRIVILAGLEAGRTNLWFRPVFRSPNSKSELKFKIKPFYLRFKIYFGACKIARRWISLCVASQAAQ